MLFPAGEMTFNLGDVFTEWGYPIFNSTNCLIYHNQPVSVYVNGTEWTKGPISEIPLTQHLEVAVLIGTNPTNEDPGKLRFPARLFNEQEML